MTGRHVAPGDPAALASALRDLLSDPAALRRMGDAARAAFEASDCRPDRNMARLLSVYVSARSAHDA
jgi:glycosyltransferase involved in cell wall biosynthesis